MQSGISASAELHEAFNSFLADPSLFCLPVTITNEQLTPLQPLSFSNNASSNDDSAFFASLPLLSSILQPKTPIYLLLRRAPTLIALTYVPSNSPVRSKTLFASTRATLVRELGSEKFGETVFAVEEEEVLSEAEWRERDADKANGKGSAGDEAEEERRRVEVMGEQERELYLLKKAEAEARSMSHRRDIGIGGDSGEVGGKQMPIGEGVKEAWAEVQNEEGKVVVVTIDVPTESINLAENRSNVSPDEIPGLISSSKPQFTFYRYPDSSALVFIYTCPSSSSIKERMLNASSRRFILKFAESEGVKVTHKIEATDGDEITKERLEEEVNPPKVKATSRGFARPKRPGR